MLCPKCGKESSNIRVCAFCQTPYAMDAGDRHGGSRSTRGGAPWRPRDPRTIVTRLSRTQRWGMIGLLAVITIGYSLVTRERDIPVGVAVPNLITAPTSPTEAASIVKTVNATAQIAVVDGELSVRLGAGAFPQRRDGQLALAQQYARADEIVEGRKRPINFLDPDGNRFARSDPVQGVVMTR